jgi:hypothetical protein
MSTSTTRKIGGSTFSAIGFGAMGISTYYGAVESDEERFKVGVPGIPWSMLNSFPQVLDAAHAAGSTFWDTADVYGDSEELLGKWYVILLPYATRANSVVNSNQVQAHRQTRRHLPGLQIRVHTVVLYRRQPRIRQESGRVVPEDTWGGLY